MKNYTFIKLMFFLALAVSVTLSACKESSQIDKVSDEDIEALTLIVSETLSDKNDGLVTDIYDVQRNLSYGSNTAGKANTSEISSPERREHAGGERNMTRGYDPDTGIHSFSYEREFVRGEFYKYMSASMQYIFYAPDESFVQYPGREEVEAIRFTGNRELIINRPMVSSQAQRSANWFLSGLSSGNVHTLSGSQSSSGDITINNPQRGTMSRSYEMNLQFVDVTIEKALRDADIVEDNISGRIQYETIIIRTVNGEEEVREISGTIELTGNGSALLRIMGLNRVYRINLADGAVSEN